jgi:hypothetical protein
VVISQANRDEFEQLGQVSVLGQIEHALYDAQKQKEAYEWLDDVAHGVDRALIREQISTAREAALAARSQARTAKAALIIAIAALTISIISSEPMTTYLSSKPWLSWLFSSK